MKKISVVAPNPEDITSYYRIIRPYGEIVKKYPDKFQIIIDNKIPTAQLFQTHAAIFQRPCSKTHLDQITTCKYLDIPVMIDLDDNLLEVPEGNPAYAMYSNKDTLELSKAMYRLANVITVSTPALKDAIKPYNGNVHVVENSYDPLIFKQKQIDWSRRNKVVLWRGGGTHSIDLKTVLPQLEQLTKERSDWTFVFFGGKDEFTDYVLKPCLNQSNTVYIKSQSMLKYAENIAEIAPSIMIVPLANNNFNNCKSNIAWIEGSSAGAVVVAPDMQEWVRPGIVNYKDPDGFKRSVSGLMDNFSLTPQLWKQSDTYIKETLLLDKINEKRIKLLNEL